MSTQRIVAGALAFVMILGISPALAQQASGTIAGKASDEAKQPYTDYAVQLRDATTGEVVSTRPLSQQGQFSFSGVTISRPYLVELFHQKERRVICTEGPYSLTPTLTSKADVNISCGKAPAALWLILAGAGAAAAIAVATRSVSR